ncbi:heterokaryon incompatibility protein-domain-containing protein, partial [Lasiosphaeria miniovina]
YQPLRKAVQEIRLPTIAASGDEANPIECAMESVASTQAPRFLALSYLWGDASTTHEIVLNGNKFPVATNLHLTLIALRRRPMVDHVWIDALCIDQSSNDEKSSQVALMGNIYSRAAQVLSWLGPAADDSDAAFELVRR